MAKIFKPRRALRSSVKSGSKRTLVLASGELMLVGKTAIGEGSKADLYLGDGVSQMQNLTPAIYGDASEEDITITDDTSTTASAALGNVTTGKSLGAILGSLKKAISLNAAAITTLNDDLSDEFSNKQNKLYYYDTIVAGTTNWKFSFYNDLGLNVSDKNVIGANSFGGNPNSYNFLVITHGSGVYYTCSPAASFHLLIWYFFK